MPKLSIGGQEYDVPDALAPVISSVIGERDKLLGESRQVIETLNKAKQEAELKAKEAADAAARKEIEAAAKAGNFDEAIKKADARVAAIAEGYRDDKLADLVRNHPKIRKDLEGAARDALVADIVASLKPSAKFDLEKRALHFEADGKQVDPASHLEAFLAARPHLRAAEVKPGSGAGANGPKPGAPTMTAAAIAELAATDPRAVARFFADGGVQV
jgi:hypothetical protein